MDPQKKANEIIAQVRHGFTRQFKHPGLSGRALWSMIGELGLAMEKAAAQPEVGKNRTPKRERADLMKVAAILQDTADQHKALEKYDVPESPITKGQSDAIADLLRER